MGGTSKEQVKAWGRGSHLRRERGTLGEGPHLRADRKAGWGLRHRGSQWGGVWVRVWVWVWVWVWGGVVWHRVCPLLPGGLERGSRPPGAVLCCFPSPLFSVS